jgi:hypothetical protein
MAWQAFEGKSSQPVFHIKHDDRPVILMSVFNFMISAKLMTIIYWRRTLG